MGCWVRRSLGGPVDASTTKTPPTTKSRLLSDTRQRRNLKTMGGWVGGAVSSRAASGGRCIPVISRSEQPPIRAPQVSAKRRQPQVNKNRLQNKPTAENHWEGGGAEYSEKHPTTKTTAKKAPRERKQEKNSPEQLRNTTPNPE